MAFPVILYHSVDGSDTAASGAGPDTAVTGTNGDASGSTITLNETKDFTGAADDGSDVLWYEGVGGGRHLWSITAFNPSVAACTSISLFSAVATATGLDWAVGGVRKTLAADTSSTDIANAVAGWTFELQASTADYVAAAALVVTAGSLADGPVTVRAATGATPVMSWTFDENLFNISTSNGYLDLEGITFTNTTSVSSSARCVRNSAGLLKATDCNFRSARALILFNGSRNVLSGCDVQGDVGVGVWLSGSHLVATDTVVHDCGADGFEITVDAGGSLDMSGCTVRDNAGSGIDIAAHTAAHMVEIANCVLHGNTSDGITLSGTANTADGPYQIYNNVCTNNGGYGISSDSVNLLTVFADFNAFRNNTSGETNNIEVWNHNVTLTADPYESESTNDFTLNTTTGGGALCRDAAYYYGRDVTWGPITRAGLPVIKYNADSGSDTAASGAGPSTAVTGTNGDMSGTTLTLNETKDFTGAADDGSDILWYEGASGNRSLMPISSFNPSVAACTTLTLSQGGTTATAKSWAVGGIRKTLINDPTSSGSDLWSGLHGWTYELQDATAEYEMASVALLVYGGSLADGPVTVRAAAGATPTVSWVGNVNLFTVNAYLSLENLTLTNTTSGSTSANCVNVASGKFARMLGCTMVSQRTVLITGARGQFIDCDISSPADIGIYMPSVSLATLVGCRVEGGGNAGVYIEDGSAAVTSCAFVDCVGDSLLMFANRTSARPLTVRNSVFHGSTGSGIQFLQTIDIASGPYVFLNNIFSENGAYGIEVGGGVSIDLLAHNDYNAYHGNTSGEVESDITKGDNSVTVPLDPLFNPSNNEFGLNLSSTGGELLEDVGIPTGWDIGVAQTDGWDIGITQSLASTTSTTAGAGTGSGKHFLPSGDTFTEGSPVYGDSLQRYIGIQPWSTESETASGGYTIKMGFGHIFDGRSGIGGPGRKASTTNHSTNVDDDRITFVVQRDTQDWQFGEVYYKPELHMLTGSYGDDTVRGVGCCARVAGGTLTTPTGGDHSDKYYADVSGYFYIHAKQSSLSHKLFLFEVSSGTPTLLNSILVSALPGGQLYGSQDDDAELPSAMRMTIEDAGSSTIRIKCYRKKFINPATGVSLGSPSTSSGVSEDLVFSNLIASPVTTTGRCGFGLQLAKTESTGRSVLFCREFRVVNVDTLHSRDRFKRVQPTASRILTDPLLASGNSLESSFTGDSQGDNSSTFQNFGHLLSDVGNNRLDAGSTPPTGSSQIHGWYMSSREADSVQQHRSIELTFINADTETVRAGIHLRGIWHPNVTSTTPLDMRARATVGGDFLDYRKEGYLCLIKYVPGGSPVWELEIRAHKRGGSTLLAYRADLIATVDLTAAGLALSTAIILDFEVRNFDTDLFGNGGFAVMRVRINGTLQTLVPSSAIDGLSTNNDFLVDSRADACLDGLAEGFYLDVSAVDSSQLMRFDNWVQETLSDQPNVGEEDEASVVLNAETVNLTGTLDTPLSWPVEQDPGGYEALKHRFETGHLQTFPRSRVPRRQWTVSCGGCTTAERLALQVFFRAHSGVEIPFNWSRPSEDASITEVVKVRFLEDTLAHFLAFLSTDGLEGYELRLEEVFDHVTFNETL